MRLAASSATSPGMPRGKTDCLYRLFAWTRPGARPALEQDHGFIPATGHCNPGTCDEPWMATPRPNNAS